GHGPVVGSRRDVRRDAGTAPDVARVPRARTDPRAPRRFAGGRLGDPHHPCREPGRPPRLAETLARSRRGGGRSRGLARGPWRRLSCARGGYVGRTSTPAARRGRGAPRGGGD